jgi:hypothetical protein
VTQELKTKETKKRTKKNNKKNNKALKTEQLRKTSESLKKKQKLKLK